MQRSGLQSASLLQSFWQAPFTTPLHVCEPPHSSVLAQPQVPLLQTPLAQSLFNTHAAASHVPPQKLPLPQSESELQALALHFALLHLPPVPQSAFEPHEAGGAHFAPLQ